MSYWNSWNRKNRWLAICGSLLVLSCVSLTFAQRGWRRGWESDSREITDRRGVPDWDVAEEFKSDVFTFARVEYDSWDRGGRSWRTDWPDSDLNFSFRLQQLTSMKVDPDGKILRLTDADLFDYPFLYIIEPGGMSLSEPECSALRRYCDNGGFVMVDDFWGEDEWDNLYREMKRVFPDREPLELPLEHPIFHIVYDLKEKPQIPSITMAQRGRSQGITWERWDAQTPHYKGIFDDNQRMVMIICHNTDLGDGWEQEGADPWYFQEFSEKKAYPLGINIITYAMTQ